MKAYRSVGALHEEFAMRREAIRKRLSEFAAVPPGEYFYELAYCLMTPQSSAAHAERAVLELQSVGFAGRQLDPAGILRRRENYIRFHNVKAQNLCRAKEQFPDIMARLSASPPSSDDAERRALREWLTRNHMILPDGRIRHSVFYSILDTEWEGVKKRLEEMLERK